MKRFLYLVILLVWLMGTLTIWVSNANGTITVIDAPWAAWCSGLKFDDGSWHVIMLLDRNRWATSISDKDSEETYWYHFQWWNNHGFPSITSSLDTRNNRVVWNAEEYENKWYFWEFFLIGTTTDNDYRSWWMHYDGLRWWSGDNKNNWRWLSWMTEGEHADKLLNIQHRQWPCPVGYHVPSIWEWNNLLRYRASANNVASIYTDDTTKLSRVWFDKKMLKFMNDFNIPSATRRLQDGQLYGIGDASSYAFFWSSSLSWEYALSFDLQKKTGGGGWDEIARVLSADAWKYYFRTEGLSVRCFYDSYLLPEFTIRFYDEDGPIGSWVVIREWDTLSEDDLPNLTGWDIDYRYLSWNETTPFDFGTIITGNIILKPHWTKYITITFDTDGWSYVPPFTGKEWDSVNVPENPTKGWFRFVRWEPAIPDTVPAADLTVKAIWEKNWWSSWWWGSSNGWWSYKTGENVSSGSNNNTTSWTNNNDIQWNTQPSSWSTQNNNQFSDEFQQAYEFAYNNWITTMPTIWRANMGWKLTRIAMAKMLSQYAINILWKNPDTTKVNKFNDVSDKLDEEYNNGVTLAYQLWIMWINMPENNFRPKDEVTRAEFATALSRMIYWTSDWEYKWTEKYYTHHMEKLMKEWVITKNNPSLKELRGYVMIMLMRSVKW